MTNYADLEISLYQWSSDGYNVDLRFNPARSDTTTRFTGDLQSLVRLNFSELDNLDSSDPKYGEILTNSLFADPQIRAQFEAARASQEGAEADLRVRLYTGPTAAALQRVRWEALRDPRDTTKPLFVGSRIFFSRYLSARDHRPIRAKPQGALRCLTAIANPRNLSAYTPSDRALAEIDVAREAAVARKMFTGAHITEVMSGGQATFDRIIEELRQADDTDDEGLAYDVFYLVCHGAIVKNRTRLYLEDDAGNVAVASGDDLVGRIGELKHQPRLVVLASCQSAAEVDIATTADKGALSGLGPRLAEAGVPAVVAMQHDVSMATATRFIETLFRVLSQTGEIDRAMAIARGEVQNRPDWWVPVLYMRLQTGLIWYVRGLGQGRPAFARWAAVLAHIKNKKCTPILGSGLAEPVFGSTREIARRWAESYRVPMVVDEREDLPQIAQYLAVTQARAFPRDELRTYLQREALRRYPKQFPHGLEGKTLSEAVNQIGASLREGSEPHQILALLRLPLYVLAKPDDLMAEAIRATGVTPHVDVFQWREKPDGSEEEPPEPGRSADPGFRPSESTPLVYHLFGKLGDPRSIVLTEDDYFDYLIGLTSKRAAIPPAVRRALTDSALLFLGFRIDEWSFRVLFRSLVSQLGSARRDEYAHVAVQIDPTDARIVEPELARQYLERYFGRDLDISIYWGSLEEFIRDLKVQWKASFGENLGE